MAAHFGRFLEFLGYLILFTTFVGGLVIITGVITGLIFSTRRLVIYLIQQIRRRNETIHKSYKPKRLP